MGFMRDIELVEKITVSNINTDDSYENNDEHDENIVLKSQALKRKKSRTKEEAIDRLADALSTPQLYNSPHHLFYHHLHLHFLWMLLMHFFIIIGHELRSLNEERCHVEYSYVYSQGKKETYKLILLYNVTNISLLLIKPKRG